MDDELIEGLDELKRICQEDEEKAELRKRMENLENDPEDSLEAATIYLSKYGHSRGWS